MKRTIKDVTYVTKSSQAKTGDNPPNIWLQKSQINTKLPNAIKGNFLLEMRDLYIY